MLTDELKKLHVVIDDDDSFLLTQFNWYLGTDGYMRSTSNNLKIVLHRLILKATKEFEVDHINGNKLDNRKSNLRLATRSQNQANIGLLKSNTSGFKGVSFFKLNNTWRARIQINSKQITLGYFLTKEEAAKRYDKAAIQYFGSFAKLNFPGELISLIL